jgi:hypothetical protein
MPSGFFYIFNKAIIMRWFKHFSKAHRDTKIKKLINEFGAEGYAVYFYCLELISDNLDSENITFELEDDAELVGQYLKIDTLKIEKIMKQCIKLELFGISEAGRITCLKMAKFLDERFTRNPILKQMIKSEKMEDIKLRLSEDTSQTNGDMSREIRLDQTRSDKNRKEKEEDNKSQKTRFIPPTLEEVIKYLKENNIINVDAEKFWHFYNSKGWMIGKNKMKNWHSAIVIWNKNSIISPKDEMTQLEVDTLLKKVFKDKK